MRVGEVNDRGLRWFVKRDGRRVLQRAQVTVTWSDYDAPPQLNVFGLPIEYEKDPIMTGEENGA